MYNPLLALLNDAVEENHQQDQMGGHPFAVYTSTSIKQDEPITSQEGEMSWTIRKIG
jgi:hypothetical protein